MSLSNTREVQYLRNADGQVSMMPLIGWNFVGFASGMMVQLQFAETPEDLKKGELGVVQLAVSAEQALELADKLTSFANRVLDKQGKPTRA